MIKRIIIAYDGSELAREAFAFAVMIAEAAKVEVMGVHAIEPPPAPVAVADPAAGFDPNPILIGGVRDTQEDRDRERARFDRELQEQEAYCRQRKVACTSVVKEGALRELLVELADPTDLIAVGMKGRFARAGFGSSTRTLVQKSPCPVLVASGPLRPVNRVLGVYDGTGASKRAVEWSLSVAEQTGWPLTLLAVSGSKLSLDDSLQRAQDMAPDAQVVHYGPDGEDASEQIEAAAEHAKMALLVMGAYADSWMHQLLFGGTTGQVLSHIKAPVVLVH